MVRPAARGLRDRTPRGRSSGRASANSIERTGVQSPRPGTVRPALWTDVQRRHESRATVRSLHEAFRGAAASGRRRDEGRVDPGGFGVRVRPPSSARTLDATPSGSAAAGLLWRDRRRDGSRHAAAVASVHARSRSELHGQDRGPVRGLLPVRLRRLAAPEPHPAGPGRLERLRQAPGREPAATSGACSRPRPSRASARSRRPAEDRRLLRRLHGRGRDRRRWARSLSSRCWPRSHGSKDRRGTRGLAGRAAQRRQHGRLLFGFGSKQDFRDATQVIAAAWSGRARAAGPRLLPEDQTRSRRRSASKYLAHVARMLELLGDDATSREGDGGDGDGDRDRAGQGVPHARGAARSVQAVPQDQAAELEKLAAGLRLEDVPRGRWASPTPRCSTSSRARFFKAMSAS